MHGSTSDRGGRRRGQGGLGRAALRAAGAPILGLSLAGAGPTTVTCPVSGLAETTAVLSVTRTGGRIERFGYSMHRPVNESAHECGIYAARGERKSMWSDGGNETVVRAPAARREYDQIVAFAPRTDGVRVGFRDYTHCGTFRLPPMIEVQWSQRGCFGRAIGWPGAGPPNSYNRQ